MQIIKEYQKYIINKKSIFLIIKLFNPFKKFLYLIINEKSKKNE